MPEVDTDEPLAIVGDKNAKDALMQIIRGYKVKIQALEAVIKDL